MAGQAPYQVEQTFQTRVVAPMQILDQKNQRPAIRDVGEKARQGTEEPMLLVLWMSQGRRFIDRWDEIRDDPSELAGSGAR